MKTKGAGNNKNHKAKPKKHGPASGGSKKKSDFKSLKKQEHRQALVFNEKKANATSQVPNKKQQPTKKRSAMAEEFRKFDERMAGAHKQQKHKKSASSAATPSVAIAAPTFVMPSATFQLQAPVQPPPQEGSFKGFLTSIQESEALKQQQPPSVSMPANRQKKAIKPKYNGQNAFAVLDDEIEEEKTKVAVASMSSFVQPATFTFGAAPSSSSSSFAVVVPTLTFQPTPVTTATAPESVEIDSDL